ncbi:Arsenite methyltransferase [Lachnellula willkommii]|uniref:Arsenite methyltransferase n=1 Tax=Lachnellula willkommii TaxID=215461 RepID=A0A559MM61_9HELO|nr:Arsenite methyltransferase [Lachnellula willkommii]
MSTTSSVTPQMVVDHYSALARENDTKNTDHIQKVAESFGYAPEDLVGTPEGANLGVSCGNPLAAAGLKVGETVIDLGSGAGFDVFHAARKVGPKGLSIGVHMSRDMLDRAQTNASKASITNVKFVLSTITNSPWNPKMQIAKNEFPEELRMDMALYVGCISGVSLVGEYEGWLRAAGFEDVMIVDKHSHLNIYKERLQDEEEASCCSTSISKEKAAGRVADIDFNDWVSRLNLCPPRKFKKGTYIR